MQHKISMDFLMSPMMDDIRGSKDNKIIQDTLKPDAAQTEYDKLFEDWRAPRKAQQSSASGSGGPEPKRAITSAGVRKAVQSKPAEGPVPEDMANQCRPPDPSAQIWKDTFCERWQCTCAGQALSRSFGFWGERARMNMVLQWA